MVTSGFCELRMHVFMSGGPAADGGVAILVGFSLLLPLLLARIVLVRKIEIMRYNDYNVLVQHSQDQMQEFPRSQYAQGDSDNIATAFVRDFPLFKIR